MVGAGVTDKRAYFKMDVGYLSNPKIATLLEEHPRAILLHVECIAYATQHLTDGVVPMRLAMRLACAEQCHLDLLLDLGLLLRHDSTNVLVHDYLEHQRSAEEVGKASDKGKRAAEARWSPAPGIASSNAPSMPDAMPNPMPRKREREKEEKTSSTDVEDRFDDFWAAYPRKVSKKNAKTKWDGLMKRRIDPDRIISGAKVYARACVGVQAEHIKHPDGWLNGERWEDDVRPITSAAGARPLQPVPYYGPGRTISPEELDRLDGRTS